MSVLTMPPDVAEHYVGLQLRRASFEVTDEDERVISLKAAPYDVEARIAPNLVESFEPGAFSRSTKDASRIKLWFGHSVDGGKIVGQAFEVEDRADGLHLQTRVSRTPSGDELLVLARDKVLDEASVEFAPMREFMVIKRRGEDVVVRHRRAHLRGVALVPAGAYGRDALVTSVRDLKDKLREEKLARLHTMTH